MSPGETRAWLVALGWKPAGEGTLRHRRLSYAWPMVDAARLESERIEGDGRAVRLLGPVDNLERARAARPAGGGS